MLRNGVHMRLYRQFNLTWRCNKYRVRGGNFVVNLHIKIADFREFFGRESIPALDDLESLPLDIAAQNEDFHRVAPSEWGL